MAARKAPSRSSARARAEADAGPVATRAEPQLLPWHAAAAEQLERAWSSGRLPHALLVQGADGLGKRSLAAWLAGAVLCEKSSGASLQFCDRCPSCALVRAGSHPDVFWVAPEEDKQQISIDQVRDAVERLSKTAYRHGYKVAIVEPAHQMTTNAANSVLKTLEEPAAGSLLVLLSSQPSALPATVRSRCQRVSLARPSGQEALSWLQAQGRQAVSPALLEFAGGAPLRALEYADGRFQALDEHMQRSLAGLFSRQIDLTQVAAEWAKEALPERLVWLDLWLSATARALIAGNDDLITFPERPAHLPSLSGTLNISSLYTLVDRVRALKAQLARTALQRELAIESWLIALMEVLAPAMASMRT